ncbi:TetR/AcrR family transcriptional regulator [Candidatus Binatia bacterium]|nr:TetR/AcrR family transcriptional regulator [Candidatus Binatia bacterium]
MGARINQRRKAALSAVQREQILEGFAAALAAKGYQSTTIADIAAAAQISKTTFYEHFADKESVFLALHATVADATIAAIERRGRETTNVRDWRARLRQMIDAYLESIAASPAFLLQIMAEAAVASPATRTAREQALDRFASMMTVLAGRTAGARSAPNPISHDLAVATMAGILELVSRAATRGPDAVRALGATVSELLARVAAPAMRSGDAQKKSAGVAKAGSRTSAVAPRRHASARGTAKRPAR